MAHTPLLRNQKHLLPKAERIYLNNPISHTLLNDRNLKNNTVRTSFVQKMNTYPTKFTPLNNYSISIHLLFDQLHGRNQK